MTLEDTAGDIIRKARQSAEIDTATAAAAAELSEKEFLELEETGRSQKKPDYQRLADLLQLDASKLERIANGWGPPEIDLGTWREIRLISTVGMGMSVNCYLVWDEVTREAALFDTGFEAGPIIGLIEQHELQLKHLFVTHTHQDHIAALGPVRERFPKARLHSSSKNAPLEQRNRSTDFIHLGSLRITNRDTPGHAEDGVTYIIGNWPDDAPNVAICGDAIFAGSIGGAREQGALAKQKIVEQIFSLPSETLICPGHGPITTV
jgi:hydroxyacylglutathione hydrolase